MTKSAYAETKRKVAKATAEEQMDAQELQWKKDYAVFLKATDKSYSYISDVVRVTHSMVKGWFEDDEIRDKVAVVQADMLKGGIDLLQRHTVDLVQELLTLARRQNISDEVKLKAIIEGLDRAGLAKVNKSESAVTKREEVAFTDPTGIITKIKDAPPELQVRVAQLYEDIETLLGEGTSG